MDPRSMSPKDFDAWARFNVCLVCSGQIDTKLKKMLADKKLKKEEFDFERRTRYLGHELKIILVNPIGNFRNLQMIMRCPQCGSVEERLYTLSAQAFCPRNPFYIKKEGEADESVPKVRKSDAKKTTRRRKKKKKSKR